MYFFVEIHQYHTSGLLDWSQKRSIGGAGLVLVCVGIGSNGSSIGNLKFENTQFFKYLLLKTCVGQLWTFGITLGFFTPYNRGFGFVIGFGTEICKS